MNLTVIMVMLTLVSVLAYPEPEIKNLKVTQAHLTHQGVPVEPAPPSPEAAIPPLGLVAHLDIVMQHLPDILQMKHAMEQIQRVQEDDDGYADGDRPLSVQPHGSSERGHVESLGYWGQLPPDDYYRELDNQNRVTEALDAFSELMSLGNELEPLYEVLEESRQEPHPVSHSEQSKLDLRPIHLQHIDLLEEAPLPDLVPNLLSMEIISSPLSNPSPVSKTWLGTSGIGGRKPLPAHTRTTFNPEDAPKQSLDNFREPRKYHYSHRRLMRKV